MLAAFLGVTGIVASVVFLSRRAERRVTDVVSPLVAGMPFSAAVASLGQPSRTITDCDEMRVFDREGRQATLPGATLHLFFYLGPPSVWILVYTDASSQKILHAEWQEM